MTATEHPPVPRPDVETEGFWMAAADGHFVICRCQECRTWMHPPLERCRACGGPTSFEGASGGGTLFSYTVIRRQSVPGHPVPYVIGLVELDEQPGLRMTGVVRVEPDHAQIGARLRVRLSPIGASGYVGPEFEPAGP